HCGGDYTGYNGTRYCSDRCGLLANISVAADGCWNWTGYKRKARSGGPLVGPGIRIDYGEFDFKNGKRMLAHRASYALLKGVDPGEMCVLHSCDNPDCVNPDHLSLGTRAENTADRDTKGRQVKGESHPFAKLTEAQAQAILDDPRGTHALARQYGVGVTSVRSIRTGKTWKHLRRKDEQQ
ncbi:MAG: HNH endonuclease, partial [Terricaulis sp.]